MGILTEKENVFVIIGSASKNSVNQKLVDRLAELSNDVFNLTIYNDLKTLPHFDPELSADRPPQIIAEFRNAIDKADGVLICTPEYAMGVPGTLKNALDWTVSSGEFSGKPVALITASTSGLKAHESLLDTLQIIDAKINEETQYLISFIQVKLNSENRITDEQTMTDLQKLIGAFEEQMENVN